MYIIFASASGNSAARDVLFVNSVCWRMHGGTSLTFLHIQINSTTNVVSSCNLLIIISSLLHQLCRLCQRSLFCTAAMQVFSPVLLVFVLHMIKIWNRKNRNRPWTMVHGRFRFLRPKPTANPKMETVTALDIHLLECKASHFVKQTLS